MPILTLSPVFGGADPAAETGQLKVFAAKADAAGFDLLLLGYGGAPLTLEPLTLAAALAPLTRRMGLSAAVSAEVGEPFTLARGFSALDHLSRGRAAWQVTGPDTPRAREFFEVARALWDSWDDDALLYDKAQADFSDPVKVRRIDHDGAAFQVRGPLNTPRPPQGRPLILRGGDDDPAWLAATADLVVIAASDPGSASDRSRRLHDLAAARGRSLRVLLETSPAEAPARRAWVDGLHILAPVADADALAGLGKSLDAEATGHGALRRRLDLPA